MRTSRLSVLLLACVTAGCGSKKEQSPATGSATPAGSGAPATGSTATGSDSSGSAAAGSAAAGSAVAGSADAVGSAGSADAAGSAAAGSAMTIDPCSFASREKIEELTAGWTHGPEPVPVTSSVLGGCSFQLANRYVTIEARPATELATLVGKNKTKKLTGFPARATAIEDDTNGDAYVTFDDKSYLIRVHADAGERNPDSRLAAAIAKLLAGGAK